MPSLFDALDVRRGDVVAVVGAGGKTTLIYRLASEARGVRLRVLVTTTTHMGTLPEAVTGPVFVDADGAPDDSLDEALRREGRVTLLGRRVRPDKLEGIPKDRVDALADRADLVLVEADGARQRSLKVPALHEPVIPGATTLVLVVAALDVLGSPLDEERVHRLDQVASATGRAVGAVVDEDAVAAALLWPSGYICRIPEGARSAVFLNKAEGGEARSAAARLAQRLLPAYGRVVAGSARGGAVSVWA